MPCQYISYKSAAKSAPRPMRPAEAIWTLPAAADDELDEDAEAVDDAEPPEVADAAPADPEPEEPEPPVAVDPAEPMPAVAPVVTLTPDSEMTDVVDLPTLTTKYDIELLTFSAIEVTPVGKPAGMVATAGWLVMTEGCVLTPAGREDCAVTTDG